MSDIRIRSKIKRALTLQQQGRLKEAADLLHEIIEIAPNDPETWFRLGSLYGEHRMGPQAETCFREIVRLRPDDVRGHFNLALALTLQDKNREAIAAYEAALRIKPDFIEAIHNLGLALGVEARFEEALAVLARGLDLQPNNTKLIASIAEIYERMGEHQKAYDTLKPLLDDAVTPPVEAALTLGKFCKRVNACTQAIEMHKKLLNGGASLVEAERMYLHFSLGRLLDAAGEYDAAFEHILTANQMKRRTFNPQLLIDRYENFRSVYTKEFFARAPRATTASSHLTFIVGTPRSGSTLVEQILASHSWVKGLGEILWMPNLVQSLPGVIGSSLPYPQCMNELTQENANALAEYYHQQVKAMAGDARRVTDKMLQNFEHLGLIALLFPQARIIHCVRDPLDSCLSCYFLHFRSETLGHTYDLTNLGIYYREYHRLMRYWKSVLDIPILEVKYEDLIDDQERWTRELLAFCDLPWEEACLNFHDSDRPAVTASYDQVRRPMYRSSMGRWKHYARHLEPLRKAIGEDS
jgi:tetratricopeptide (TPR) repeat protein